MSWQSAKTPGWRKLASSSGGVFEPHTITMPYLHNTCFQSVIVAHCRMMCCTALQCQEKGHTLRTGHRVDTRQTWFRAERVWSSLANLWTSGARRLLSERGVELVGGRDAKSRVEDSLRLCLCVSVVRDS